jgi:hypothetical protein
VELIYYHVSVYFMMTRWEKESERKE